MQDCHTTAWNTVTKYMENNMRVFSGKVDTADSVIMPGLCSWISEALSEVAEVRDSSDHAIVGWLCLPTCGVIGAQKWDLFITLICNLLSNHRKNGLVLIIHSNRAAQVSRSSPATKTERTF